MKVKILVAVALCLGSFAFVFKDEFSKVKIKNIPVGSVEKKLTPEEQQKFLEYLLSAREYKLEFETGYRNIETGQIIEDNSRYGNGVTVIHCSAGLDRPGYIKGAKIPGREGINTKYSNDTLQTFYIKPRMRIERELIYPIKENYNDQNRNTQICRLEVINTEGKIIREIEFLARDFMERHPDDECRLYYSGNYHEGYGGYLGQDSLIVIGGKEINPKGKVLNRDANFDIRIYWYGYTDVWLDFIEVKNDPARDLLNGGYDMWLNAMNNDSAEKMEELRSKSYSEKCFEYIYKKIGNKEFSLLK